MTKWSSYGWEAGQLGYPTTDEIPNGDNIGSRQDFQKENAAIYWNSSLPLTGITVIKGMIRSKWNTLGAQGGSLGYPITDETDSIPVIMPAGEKMQVFASGTALVFSSARVEVGVAGWETMNPRPDHGPTQADQSNRTVTPRFQSACPTGTTDLPDGYSCVKRFQDVDGTWINLRAGKANPNGFGQIHYKLDHSVSDRQVELILQDSYATPLNFDPEGGPDRTPNPDRYVYSQLFHVEFMGERQKIIALGVFVDFAHTSAVYDSTQFGILTAYCMDPNHNDNIIQHCPTLPAPYDH
ncbi:LGFP repeat-containing protein [Prescottella subtropica]|uniref:LGFP repeat-containing protein n=1 Tax=Prescottella subtropica TaxID=2545757 RepID=UPI00138741EE|nr:hypothetical protein [Prescottella subtropica]